MTYRWFIEPREPIVVREGRSAGAIDERSDVPLPLPNTLAGLVRACFVQDTTRVDPDELLRIRIEDGPWFGHMNEDGSFDAHVPAPDDAVGGIFAGVHCMRRAKLVLVGDDILLWPAGGPKLRYLVRNAARADGRTKTTPATDVEGHRFWTLDRAVQWATSRVDCSPLIDHRACEPIEHETRVHVALDDKTGTAEQGMLYGTPGLRFHEGYGFAFELGGIPDRLARIDLPNTVFLGGEGRVSYRADVHEDTLPRFAKYRPCYEAASKNQPAGLRLQLVTPAWLSPNAQSPEPGWLPSWWQSGKHPALPKGICLKLVAACLPRAIAISGWDLQWKGRGGPRAVRRLAPAGSIFYFELQDDAGHVVTSADAFVDVAEKLWAQAIEPPDEERSVELVRRHLAHPARDGFGRMLPGYFWTNEGLAS